MAHPDIGPRLPRFVRTCSTTGEFWGYIKEEAKSYADRRRIISEAFASILDDLATGDVATTSVYERIEPPVGQGGFGVVWKYRHRHLDIPFAFKIFAPSFSEGGTSDLERFFREARILFRLRHPDIVQIYDVGMMGRRPFIRMEFCDGENLNALLRRKGRIPPAAARRLVRRLAGALDHAHGLGIVHRDLKPSNVMIGPRDTRSIRLIDFGLGVFVEQDIVSRVTKTGEAVAGGHYTPPELYANPKLIDARTDLYSLGAIWYEMLTGRPPVGAGIHAALDDVGDLPVSERALVLRCLADLADRPASASAILAELPE
jgi:serine/threonine-protein kinase